MAKYYVVRIGQRPGIYSTWAEAKKYVLGFPGAEYKSFTKKSEAEAYLGNGLEPPPPSVSQSFPPSQAVILYTDGSSKKEGKVYKGGFGALIIRPPSGEGVREKKYHYYGPVPSQEQSCVSCAQINSAKNTQSQEQSCVSCAQINSAKNTQSQEQSCVSCAQINSAKNTQGGQGPSNDVSELYAILMGLEAALTLLAPPPEAIEVRSDSEYAVKTLNSWLQAWKKKSGLEPPAGSDCWQASAFWRENQGRLRLASGGIPANLSLILAIDERRACGGMPVSFVHVRGHAGEAGNEEADRLAEAGRLARGNIWEEVEM